MRKLTLNRLREFSPCKTGWEKLLKNLGKKKADDEPISLQKILESNGLLDTLWCFRALPTNIKMQRSISGLALLFVNPIVPLMQDKRSVNAVVVLEKFYLGTANLKELKIATAAADAAASAAAAAAASAADAADAAAATAADAAFVAAFATTFAISATVSAVAATTAAATAAATATAATAADTAFSVIATATAAATATATAAVIAADSDSAAAAVGAPIDMNGNQMQWSKGADVASGTALPVLTDGNYFDVTGTTPVTSIDTTGGPGTLIKLHFDDAVILTHDATDLIMPNAADYTTAAGDEIEITEYANGDYRVTAAVIAADSDSDSDSAAAAVIATANAATTAAEVKVAAAATSAATTAEKKKATAIQIKILTDWILENNL
jgi:hypothetical protein